MSVGVLALQGCVDPHLEAFSRIGVDARRVRTLDELKQVDHLVMPGGESTTMLKLLDKTGLDKGITDFARAGNRLWGICAGAILLAREVQHPAQRSLALIDLQATRNYYGSQLDSFKARVDIPLLKASPEVDFIRAPLLTPLSPAVETLASLKNQPVLFRQDNVVACSFHIELTADSALHRYFAGL